MSNQPKNIWDTMVLFNQLTLRNILNGRDDLGTPEVRMAVAALAEEQKADALLFLNNNIEALAALPSVRGSLAVELVKRLLDGMPTELWIAPRILLCGNYIIHISALI